MSVLPSISLGHVQEELAETKGLIDGLGLSLDASMLSKRDLRFRVRGCSRKDDELYIVEFRCDDYRELPPWIELIDPQSGEGDVKSAYPDCFHGYPVVCAQFNRKAYPEHSGLHENRWTLQQWSEEAAIIRLGGMINHIFTAIHGYAVNMNYSGRMQ